MTANPFEEINQKLEQVLKEIDSLRQVVEGSQRTEIATIPLNRGPRRRFYTVGAAAKELGKTTYTVREWCRLGRINAKPSGNRRGRGDLWSISAEEIDRYLDEGLLEIEPSRNKIA